MPKNFIAFFHDEYPITNAENKIIGYRLEENKQVKIPFSKLAEVSGSEKPINDFVYNKGQYTFVPEAIKKFTTKGEPIINYVIGKSLPITEDLLFSKYDAHIKYQVFHRGEAKAAIAGFSQEKGKFDIMALMIGVSIGGLVGFIIGYLLKK